MSLVLRETGENVSLQLRDTGDRLILTLRNYLGCGVIQVDTLSDFPEAGDASVLYLALDTGKLYYWDVATLGYIETAGGSTQVQADWDQDDDEAVDYIKNKPSIPAAQIQSDWNQSSSSAVDYIKNKPTIPTLIITFNDQPDSYALLASDVNKHIRMTKATACNLTINDVFASGESCTMEQNGAGQVTFVAGSGVTIRSADNMVKTRVQYSGVTIIRTPIEGEYVIYGDLA